MRPLPAVYTLARLLWRRGALDEAAALLGAARPAEAAQPADRGHRTVDLLLGLVALRRRDLVAAHDHLMVALRSRVAYGFRARTAEALAALAVRCLAGGDPLTAARLIGAAQAARARLRLAGWDGIGGYWRDQQAAAREAVGDDAFDQAYADGAELPLDDAVALALTVEHPDLMAGLGPVQPLRLEAAWAAARRPARSDPPGQLRRVSSAGPSRPVRFAGSDPPGVARAEQGRQFRLRFAADLRLGHVDLRAYQVVVGRAVDRRGTPRSGCRAGPTPGSRDSANAYAGSRHGRVVHDDLGRVDVGGVAHLQAERRPAGAPRSTGRPRRT